jgi:hypothetical protein
MSTIVKSDFFDSIGPERTSIPIQINSGLPSGLAGSNVAEWNRDETERRGHPPCSM